MQKIAVLLFGPPGSGKGTQANLLSNKMDLVHFDTGHFLERVFNDPARQREKIIQRGKKYFDGGILTTPSFVTNEVMREIRRLAKADWSLVFSGSPRTLYETEHVMPLLRKLYGKNVFTFELRIPAATTLARNSQRMVCKFCGYGLLSHYITTPLKHCPVCSSPFYRRTLDNPKTIPVRLKQYADRTEPIFKFIRDHGFRFHQIDARPAPYRVFEKIYGQIKNARRN